IDNEKEKNKLECPECEYTSRSVKAWCEHLKIKHSTTPSLMTPQCLLCKKYPKTPRGYTEHLRRMHKTTMLANRIFLKCVCGTQYNHENDYLKHDKKCPGNDYTLHKLDED
ncbi:hypothetical protein PMAYCL1PPCAC_14250, partial [Pristionchus mayeri]